MRRSIGRSVISTGAGLASVAGLTIGACAGDPAPLVSAGIGATPSSPCIREQSPVVLADGTELYVEPQTLFRLGDDWMVAGSPSYQWSVAPDRDALSVSREAHVAAVLGTPAVPIERPRNARTGSMISTPLGDGRWAAIFDEVHPDSIQGAFSPLSWWYGEHDGTRWTLVEPLPVPPGAKLDLRQSSNLVRAGDRLVWISFEHLRPQTILHRYERIDGLWRFEPLPDEWVERVVLQVDAAGGSWMLLTGQDEDLDYLNTIRLYRDGPSRELVSRVTVVPGSTGVIYHPSVEVGRDGATVSWVVANQDGWRAFARSGIRQGREPDAIVELDDNAIHLYSMTMPDGSVAWIAEHQDRETVRKEIRLLRLDGSRVVLSASAPSPFTGFFRTAPAGPDEVLLVGPQMGLVSPETPVRSLILRLSTSC